ncbi:MAG: 30S ribosomal protein S1 [bacterium]
MSDDKEKSSFEKEVKNEEESFDKLIESQSSFVKNVREGRIVKGSIVAITGGEVLIDIGCKSEGVIPLKEFPFPSSLKVGQTVDVLLEKLEDQEGNIVISKEKADFMLKWDEVRRAYESNTTVKGKIIGCIKGGLTVDIGVKAFLPTSQLDLQPVQNINDLIGKTFSFKVVKLNRKRRNIVLSRKAAIIEEREMKRQELIETLSEGRVVNGIVKNITDFGVFVDIGGIDGLIHITDLSWGRINHPAEVVSINDEVKVKVLSFDREKVRVSLGLKQMEPHPWANIEERYKVGDVVKGKIVSVLDYGAFLEIERGVEGLVHISEISWTHRIKHPSEVFKVGEEIETMILSIDKDNERISLGIRQLTPNPWNTLEERFPIGKKFKGKIKSVTDFGLFIGVEEGIDGLVHISDIFWGGRPENPQDTFRVGQVVDVVVLSIDKVNQRVSLGMKQLTEDAWSNIEQLYKVGDDVEGEIVKVANFGAIVRLPEGIEGLLHISEVDEKHIDDIHKVLKVGEKRKMKIISISPKDRRMGLSIREYKRVIRVKKGQIQSK